MVLNVWPAKLATLDAERKADRARYLQLDPAGKVSDIPAIAAPMPCAANVYEGSDHIDDVVVFCDPGKASGIRLSWSMTLAANDHAAARPAGRVLPRGGRYRLSAGSDAAPGGALIPRTLRR